MIIAGINVQSRSYAELFIERAKLNSSSPAIVHGQNTVSYGELDVLSDRIARRLLAEGLAREGLAGVYLERSVPMIASLLGIWKAGGAYLPLDVSTPPNRIAQTLASSGAGLVITSSGLSAKLQGTGLNLLLVDNDSSPQDNGQPVGAPGWESRSSAQGLAYVIYTSGSTGEPQGVEITHGSLLHHNLSVIEAFNLEAKDRVLQFASLAFDLSVEEIFPTLLAGGTLVLRSEECIGSIPRFLDFVRQNRVSVLDLPTAFWHQLAYGLGSEQLPDSVRLVVIGGEKASDEAWQRWQQVVGPRVRLVNTYGPTETTVSATLSTPHPNASGLDIGKPLGKTEVYVLDTRLKPVKAGETGELFIGGPGVARGYRHNPALTKQRFITVPEWLHSKAERLYRTGDLVRELPGGNMQFVGRNDQQIKIRGYRVEPAEITAAILACPGISDAAVVACANGASCPQLVGYYASENEKMVTPSGLHDFLKAHLPRYLVPAALVPMPSIPRNTSGKLDVSLLPSPGSERPALSQDYTAPNGVLERQLASIWQEVLQINAIGAQDNFFDLGGDSLRAVQVASRVRERFNVDLPISSILDSQTIEAMARRINEAISTEDRSVNVPLQHSHECPASFVQERLWFLHRLNPSSDAYNLPFALRLKGKLDIPTLARAIQTLVARHDVLRATLREVSGEVIQCVRTELDGVPLELPPFKVPNEQAVQKLLAQEARVPFDLENGPLFRVRLIRRSATEHVLLVVAHHAVFDGWSVGLFINELQSLYERLAKDRQARNPAPPPAQYAHYARWQRQHMQGAALERELSWWKENLEGARGEIMLAPNPTRLPSPSIEATRLTIKLTAARTRRLRQAAQKSRATPFTLLLTTLASALNQLTGQDDLVIGTVVAGRTRREYESLLGCFMNFLPVRIRTHGIEDLTHLLQHTRRALIEAQSHQECPFEKIVSTVNPDRATANPIYNVALLWQEFPTSPQTENSKIDISSMEVFTHGNLLDLRIEAEPAGSALNLNCEYNPQAISGERMQELVRLWLGGLSELIGRPRHSPIARAASCFGLLRRMLAVAGLEEPAALQG